MTDASLNQVTIVIARNPYNEHYDAAVSTGPGATDDGLGMWLRATQVQHPHFEAQDGERATIVHGNPAWIAGRTPDDVLDMVKQVLTQETIPA